MAWSSVWGAKPIKEPVVTGLNIILVYRRGHQSGARGYQAARKNHERRPRACSKNNISMVNVFTLTNINTKVIEGQLCKIFISEMCIKLVALPLTGAQEVARSFENISGPWYIVNGTH